MYPGWGHSIAVIPPWEGVLDSSLAVCFWDRRSGWGWGIFCDLSILVGGGLCLFYPRSWWEVFLLVFVHGVAGNILRGHTSRT